MADQKQSQDKFILRLPDGMRDRIKNMAHENNRSMNAEIVDRLNITFKNKNMEIDAARLKATTAIMDRLIARMAEILAASEYRRAVQKKAGATSDETDNKALGADFMKLGREAIEASENLFAPLADDDEDAE